MRVLQKAVFSLLGVWVLASVVATEAFRPVPRQAQALTLSGAAPNWVETGEVIRDQFGSASAACDINGDGYFDLIVGAPGSRGGNSQGRIYVYYGSVSGLVHLPVPFSLTGDTGFYYYFGSSLACADFNGDGNADVLVGEYGYNNSAGIAYVYLGSPSGLGTTRALTLNGQARDNKFGFSLAGVGDVNGDGYADFVVGAPGYNDGLGKAQLFLGGPSLSTTPVANFIGMAGAFGKSVASAGDANGDGFADVLISAPDYNNKQGQSFLYFGSSSGLSATPVLTLTGEATDNYFGQSGGTVGDVNGDGYADVLVGASGYARGSDLNVGRAYLYLGGQAGLSATPALTLTGDAAGDFFGRSLGTIGDVNGDGYADAVVGADGYLSNQGRAYLYLGSQAGLNATAALTLTDETAAGRFGGSVGGAGDVNGDGYADIAVGAPGDTSLPGAISVYHGSAFLPSAAPRRIFTGEENDQLGVAVATAGDVNGDGYADIIVGAKGYGSGRGQTYLYLGSSAGLGITPALTLTGEAPDELFGASVATAGDVNGDGFADVIVGMEGYDSDRGRAYVFLGTSAGLQITPALTLTGDSPGELFGAAAGTAGDVNGDGYTDFVIGACGANRAYIYHGGISLSAVPSLALTGESSTDLFGRAVATAGDVNGDGYADVIIGAEGYGGLQGRAYVYLGESAGLEPAPALTLTGGIPGDFFGAAVGTVGDVNGDGYADFVVGASGAGQAYVYSGGATLAATPALTLTGGSPGDHFGGSAGTAGDVNGDGYSDIIVGAGGAAQGQAYVYLGDAVGVGASPALTMSDGSASSHFGSAVGTAGDVDGDGYADLLVGAYGFGKSQQGRVYLHLGNGGGGKGVLAIAERPIDGLLIQPWALSRSVYGFRVSLRAADPLGRGRVKLQTQICPPGTAFSDQGCKEQTAPTWMDVAANPTVTLTITDLDPSTLYRWRARVLYAPYSVTSARESPHPAHGPWRRFLAQSQEADVKTARLYKIHLPLIAH